MKWAITLLSERKLQDDAKKKESSSSEEESSEESSDEEDEKTKKDTKTAADTKTKVYNQHVFDNVLCFAECQEWQMYMAWYSKFIPIDDPAD